MNNIFISPLDTPDNALIDADIHPRPPPPAPLPPMADKIMPLAHGN